MITIDKWKVYESMQLDNYFKDIIMLYSSNNNIKKTESVTLFQHLPTHLQKEFIDLLIVKTEDKIFDQGIAQFFINVMKWKSSLLLMKRKLFKNGVT